MTPERMCELLNPIGCQLDSERPLEISDSNTGDTASGMFASWILEYLDEIEKDSHE